MTRIRWLVATALVSATALACGPRKPPDNVLPEAQTRAAALATQPGAQVRSWELEREGGRWVYSYDLDVPDREGVEEVLVDALTGTVVGTEHETEGDEAREAREGEGRT